MKTAREVIYNNVLQHGLDAGITEDIAQIVATEMSKQPVYQQCLKDYAEDVLREVMHAGIKEGARLSSDWEIDPKIIDEIRNNLK